MNATRTSAALPALAALRTQTLARWRSFAPRERLALAMGGLLLALFIVWSLLVAPAWRVSRDAPVELDRLEVQLQQMQRLAADARTLKGAPAVSPAQAVEPLKAATARLGNKASLVFQGDRATLTLTGVSGEALRDWLSEARSAAHARPIDVQLTRSGDGYAGLVVVTLGAGTS
jgi:general secretion pathway protein M